MAAKDKKKDYIVFQNNSSFRGNLEFSVPLKILGKYEGDIKGDEVLNIGEEAVVEANIDTVELIVFGKIVGNITAKEKVELKKGSQVIGNIRTPNLMMEEDVIFDGQCEMTQIVENTINQ